MRTDAVSAPSLWESIPIPDTNPARLGSNRMTLVFCTTDALADALTASGQPIGIGGLRALLQSLGELPPQEIVPAVLETLEQWNSENFTRDRVTAMLLRINSRKIPLQDNLLAPFRLLGGFAGLWPDRPRKDQDA